MLLTKTLIVNIGSATKKHYEDKGYTVPKIISKRDWKLEVRVEDLPPTSDVKVECACEGCGVVRIARYRDLSRSRKSKLGSDGKTYCSSCVKRFYHAEKHPWYIHGNPLYTQYKTNAIRRNHVFNLTVEEFVIINHKPCHYCGGMNEFVRNTHSGNGVDRMDNKKGYDVTNCVPCCTICNRAKHAMAYGDFIKWIERLVENNVKQN